MPVDAREASWPSSLLMALAVVVTGLMAVVTTEL
jgi:hypothetical protein